MPNSCAPAVLFLFFRCWLLGEAYSPPLTSTRPPRQLSPSADAPARVGSRVRLRSASPAGLAVARPAPEAALDFKKLGNALTVIGALVLVIAIAWWLYFYNSLAKDFARLTGSKPDAGVSDAFSCLYSSSGACALVSGVAALAGRTPYEPMLFWFGLAAVVLGLLIRFTAKPGGAT
jgi:hypothetical protein